MANYYLNDDGSTSTKIKSKGTNYIMQNDGSTIISNPIPKKKKKNRKEKSNIIDKVSYVTKKTGSGVLGGLTNIVNSGLQEVENDLKNGSKISDKSDILKKAGIGLLETLTPIVGTVRNQKETRENIKKIVSDKSKNNYEKVIESGLEAFTGTVNSDKKGLKDSITVYGAVNKDAHNKVNKIKKKVNNPSVKMKESLDRESEKYGNVTNFIGNTFETIGNMVPSIAASAITKNPNLSLAVMAANSKGQSTEEALKNGASLNEAIKIGNAKGALEVGTEKLTGGLNLFGKGKLDDIVENNINKNIKNKALNYLSKQGTGILGEIGEETLSDIGGTLIDKGTVNPNEKYTLDDFKNTAAQTALSTLLLNGISGSYGKKAYQKNSQELEKIIKQKSNGKITEKEAVEKVNNILSQGNTDVIDINNKNHQATLPTGLNNSLNSNYQNEQTIESNPLVNNNHTVLPIDPNTYQKIINQNTNIEEQVNNVNISNKNNIGNILDSQNINNNFAYVKSENSKIDNLRKSANEYLNNSDTSKSFIETAEKVITDKGYNIVLDNTLTSQNGNMVNAQIKTLENGEIEIKINPNSDRAGEFLLTHEITHAIENQEMIDLVMDYASKNRGFNESLESLKQTYGTNEVSSEVLADISGQLFGNEEFINTLSTKKPNIFKRLYDSIISLANKITGNSKESLFIKDLKSKWETAYRNNQNNSLQGDQYSLLDKIRKSDGKNRQLSNELVEEIQHKTKDNVKNKEDVALVPIDEILPLKKSGGYRTSDEINKLTNNIMANGIENPVEIIKDENGNLELYNGNHRLMIAEQLGLKEIPVKYREGNHIENISNSNYNDDIDKFYKGEEDGNFTGTKKSKESINQSKSNTRYSLADSKQSSDRQGISRNGKLSDSLSGYNDRTSSDSTFKENDKSKKQIEELENSSFFKEKNKLVNSDGKSIDISNLEETRYMKQFTSSRKYNKDNIKAYRGVSEDSGSNPAFYGLGMYSTLDKNYAQQYGDVIEVDSALLPDNPIKFKTQNDFHIWEQELAKELGIRKSELYSSEYGIEQYVKKLGYDGLMIGSGKDTDLVSYKEVAQKYSISSDKWRQHLEENYQSSGTKSYFYDMRKTETKTTEERILKKKSDKIQKRYETDKKKTRKFMTKEVSKILEFSNYKAKEKFTDLISEYYDNPDYNRIKRDIIENFSEQKIEYVNEEIKEIKNNIRSTDLKVDDYIKKNITDYAFFRKSNFNKLKLKNKGQSVDSFYTEMSDAYPSVFSKDLTNEVDQLQRLSEFMDEDSKIVEKYRIEDQAIEEATKYIYDSIKNKDNIDDLINSISISPKEVRKEKTIQYREEAENFVNNSVDWIDKKSGLAYKTNTMKRNFYDVMGKKDGARLYSNYIQPIFSHNAQMQKDITNYNEKISKLNLNEKESQAVQMFGEYKYNPETLVTGMQVNDFLEKNKLDHKKIENAVEVFRKTYDELFERVNSVLREQGYKEVDYRRGYFPHFVDERPTGIIGKTMEKIGWKFKNDSIPTSIAGITDTFKPGKVWTSFQQARKGKITDYNALKGMDNYIRGAMETIYFTEDIQKLRALENEIRYQHSDKGIQAKIDELYDDNSLSFEDRQDKIEKIYSTYITPLNNLVTELRDYTNGIANKKSGLDRTVEALTNRKYYNVMENVSNRLSANMVGMNFSSAITNFIPITQATSQIKFKYLIKGLKDSIKNQYSADNFESKSVFLTSRLNAADTLYKTRLDKVSEKMNFMFDGIDSITSNTIVRGKYYENKAKGMTDFAAMRNADEFARDLMAGRTKGEMPTAFNSKNPLIKTLTAFQLEVNNQFGYMFKDLPRDLSDEGKNKLVGAFIKMFLGAWIYNQLTEKVVGRKSAFSPGDTIREIYDTATNDNFTITEKSSTILENLTQDIPFVGGIIGGGRLPISSALPSGTTLLKSTDKLLDKDKKNNKEALIDGARELSKPIFYTALPFGGGQLKKTVEGASMYVNDRKTKGSYSSKGQLRFEAEKDPASVAQSLIFGQYAGKNGREYFNNGYSPLTDDQLKEVEDMNISVSKYRQYQDDKKEINKVKSDKGSNGKSISGSAAGKKAYLIMNSNFSKKEKNYLLSKISNLEASVKVSDLEQLPNNKKVYKFYYGLSKDSKKDFINEINNYNVNAEDLYNYYSKRKKIRNDYTSKAAKKELINYIKNSNFDEKAKWHLYNKDYGSDTSELLVNTFKIKTDDYFNTMEYADGISNKYQGTKNSKIRKQKVFEYINNLKCSQQQKIVLFSQAGYSTSSYKNSMYKYINNLNLSRSEKETIWKSLY